MVFSSDRVQEQYGQAGRGSHPVTQWDEVVRSRKFCNKAHRKIMTSTYRHTGIAMSVGVDMRVLER